MLNSIPLKSLILVLVACGPLGPREVTGGPRVEVRAEIPARMVASEVYPPGAHLVFVDESGRRVADLTAPPVAASLDITPAWSPDGKMVAFASSRGRGQPGETSLWLVPADRSAPPMKVTNDDGVDLSPSFSPDGQRLVFASTRGGGRLHLWILDLATRRLTQLTGDAGEQYAPSWSHHGDLIACTLAASVNERQIGVLQADGLAARVLTTGAQPAFSPDDRTLVFVDVGGASDERPRHSLWRIGVDGGERRLLVEDPLGDASSPGFDGGGRFVIASSSILDDAGRPIFATLVAVDLADEPPRLRALIDSMPAARRSAAESPTALDAAVLDRDPDYREAMRQILLTR